MKIVNILALSAIFAFGSGVSIDTASFKKVIIKTKDNKKKVEWVKPSKAVPKDTIKVVDTIKNDTNATLNSVKVVNPIDKSLLFQKGSIKSKLKVTTQFSLDGKKFDNAKNLFVVGKDGKKHLATAKDYKAVQFVIDKVAPNSKETIEYLTKIK